jgi:hypothetical protein
MVGEHGILMKSFEASTDMSTAGQYRFVKMASATTIALCGDGELAIGILQNNPAQYEQGNVMMFGISKLKVGTAGIASVMAYVSSDGNGDGDIAHVAADKAIVNALSLGTGVDNDLVSVLVIPGGLGLSV